MYIPSPATHHITWFNDAGEERSYIVSEDSAWHHVGIALRMGFYVTLTPVSAYPK